MPEPGLHRAGRSASGRTWLHPIASRPVCPLSITLPVHRCKACGEWALAGYEDRNTGEMFSGSVNRGRRRYYVIAGPAGKGLQSVVVDPKTGKYFGVSSGTRLFRAPCPEHESACNDPRCSQQECPHCERDWTSRDDESEFDDRGLQIWPMTGAEHFVLGVAAETVLYGMPAYPDTSCEWKPGKGRRLLCFSDSRREAARLGPLLSAHHQTWIVRSAIAHALAEHSLPSAS